MSQDHREAKKQAPSNFQRRRDWPSVNRHRLALPCMLLAAARSSAARASASASATAFSVATGDAFVGPRAARPFNRRPPSSPLFLSTLPCNPVASSSSGDVLDNTSSDSVRTMTPQNGSRREDGRDAKISARRVSSSPASLEACGSRLRSGGLVAFPTETVYGLGCHALDASAVEGVFKAKERPLSDPLIVHVTEEDAALKLWSACSQSSSSALTAEGGETSSGVDVSSSSSDVEALALRTLASAFWPGPLTLVAAASPDVPSIVTASTGYVACRSPSHPVARAVIDAAGVPIAAPSANKFGHVSPTRADHVLDDLGREDVWVVDPTAADDGTPVQKANGASTETSAQATANGAEDTGVDQRVCHVGVESTVAKVEMSSAPSSDGDEGDVLGSVVVLRHGAVSPADIRRALAAAGLAASFDVRSLVRSTADHVANVAPGQTVRHYSPDVLSFMIASSRYDGGGSGAEFSDGLSEEELDLLTRAVVIDFGGKLGALFGEGRALAYRDLSPSGDSAEAAATVFEALRWAENVEGAERVYFPEVVVGSVCAEEHEEDDALAHAVKDRLTRAASGELIETLR